MSVKIAFLGTGTCHATKRNLTSIALSNGKEMLLLDCGGGCYHQLTRIADNYFRFDTVSTILLSHFHADHVSGLIDILWGEMWASRGPRKEPITIVGPPGLKNFINTKLMSFIGDYQFPFQLNIMELSPGESFNSNFFSAKSYKLAHNEPSTGFLIQLGAVKLAFTGDTGYCDNLIPLLSRADMAIMEWSHPGESDYPYHIPSDNISSLIEKKVLPEKVYIIHIYITPGLSFEEQVSEIRKSLGNDSARFFFPTDLDIVNLG